MTTYSLEDKNLGPDSVAAPVPPCILPTEDGGTEISLEIDDRADVPAILKISADHIRLQVSGGFIADFDAPFRGCGCGCGRAMLPPAGGCCTLVER